MQTVLGSKSEGNLSLITVQRPLCTDRKHIINHLNQSVYNEAFINNSFAWQELQPMYHLRDRDTMRRLMLNCQHRFAVLQPESMVG